MERGTFPRARAERFAGQELVKEKATLNIIETYLITSVQRIFNRINVSLVVW